MTSKRSHSPAGRSPEPDSKRQRFGAEEERAPSPLASQAVSEGTEWRRYEDTACVSLLPTHHHHARRSLQRSIALLLRQSGFVSASPEAMESFTALVETFLDTIVREIKRLSLAARRELPIPTDFALAFHYFNISLPSLKSHLKKLAAGPEMAPTYCDISTTDESALATLPLLCPELSARTDKESKAYIPSSFPDFPSRHTFRFTPREETSTRDPKKMRQEAARTAQHGEDALRRLVRASKMRKQKEVKSLVERDSQGRERYRLWELAMKRFAGAKGLGVAADQADISEQSMIVNGEAYFARKDISRLGKR